MKEQLITFETAKLAVSKGYPANKTLRDNYYNHKGELNGDVKELLQAKFWKLDVDIGKLCNYVAPTQSLLQKWLRDKHHIHVEPSLNFTNDEYILHYNCGVMYNIKNPDNFKWFGSECSYTFYNTYEESLEAGLIEALNLIE